MPATHTADFQTATVKATNLDAVEKINVGIETDKVRKHLNIVADAPEIRIQDKIGSAPEDNETTMAIVADGGATHFRAGTTTFAEGDETKGNVKFQSTTGATTHAEIVGSSGKLELQDGGLGLKLGSNVSVSGTPSAVIQEVTGPHARESAVLKKFPEVVFADGKFDRNDTTNTYTQAGYTVTASSNHTQTDTEPFIAFDGVVDKIDKAWLSGTATYDSAGVWAGGTGAPFATTVGSSTYYGEWLQVKIPNPVQISKFLIYPAVHGSVDLTQRAPKTGKLVASNNGSTWTLLKDYALSTQPQEGIGSSVSVTSGSGYKYFRLIIESTWGGYGTFTQISELELYGYEEVGAADDSVDTTVKSVYRLRF